MLTIKVIFWDTKVRHSAPSFKCQGIPSANSRLSCVCSLLQPTTPYGEIAHPAILERITLGSPLSGQALDTRKYGFLQSRINRDEAPDLFDNDIRNGINDFWERFQKPFATSSETYHLDEQVVRGAVDELLGFNGWAAAACSSLTRPFGGRQSREDDYSDLARPGALYYFALVVHGADHFLIDQLAVIVQLSKRLGSNSIFVSLVDYASTDSTPFICDIAEAVMILLGISFRIRQVPPMTSDPTASYYPLEEAYTRNLALEPLNELWERRKVKFHRVIWLKGFTCPNDILETIRVSEVNDAAMVCSMDWKEHNGFFIYNDRWRTRDMDGNLFRGSKSTSPIDEAPPRDAYGGARYTLHLPFQVFCCESGTHIVDPHKSYYHGVSYQSSVAGVFNTSAAADHKAPRWTEGPCMDSSQLHFCRDMWMVAFREGIRDEAKRLQHDERLGKQRQVHPFMEELIQAMLASYAPAQGNRLGYANSGDYLADETGAAPGGGPGMDNSAARAAAAGRGGLVGGAVQGGAGPAGGGASEEEEEEEGEEEEVEELDAAAGGAGAGKAAQVIAGAGAADGDFDETEAGAGRPIDLAVKIEDERPGKKAAAPPRAQAEANFEAADKKVAAQQQKDAAQAAKVQQAAKDMGKVVVNNDPAGQAQAGQRRKAKRSWFGFGPEQTIVEDAHESSLVSTAADGGHADDLDDELVKRSRLESRAPRSLPNRDFSYAVARIMVNPRCVTTYAGVSHTQLALDLFGTGEDDKADLPSPGSASKDKYTLDEWRTPPESFVCQEMRTTGGELRRALVDRLESSAVEKGWSCLERSVLTRLFLSLTCTGRIAPKQQRRTGFQMARLLLNGWRPTSRANE